MKATRSRKQKGAGIAVITLMIGGILISSLGLFTFEMLRHNTCFAELRSACEAAALAGAAAMASCDDTNTANTRAAARQAAEEAFRANSIVGLFLASADTSSMNASNFNTFKPPNNQSAMFVEFVDPKTGTVVTDDTNPNGRVVRVSAAFTNEPPFGRFLGIPAAPMRTRANSSVPQLDVVMCFDTSGSIDDQTPITFVQRVVGSGRPNNYVKTPTQGNTATAFGEGRIYDLIGPGPTGTGFNGHPPQNCSSAGGARSYNFNRPMRGGASNDDSQPATMAASAGNSFSDVVVNIDGKNVFGGYSVSFAGQTYDFPDIGVLVEASRGNLETDAIATSSGAKASLPMSSPGTIMAKAGYRDAYLAAAKNASQPIGAARLAAIQFFQIMHNNTDAHFGFVSFETNVHNAPNTTQNYHRVSTNYTNPPQITLARPGVELSQTDNKLTDILTAIPKTQAEGSTNMGGALTEAVRQLKKTSGLTRSLSKRAVVMFTDGQPTTGPSWSTAAADAKADGIQIYTVGLAQNSAIIPAECENLNAGAGQVINYTDPITNNPGSYTPSGDGMAAAGAPGGKFFLVTKGENLRYVFENIARNLVQLVKTQ
jgi:membrane-associated protease RseP (regulator of RpoE activity)